MNFELSDDQLALRDGARELLDGLAAPRQVRAVIDTGRSLDSVLWQAMVDQGWTGIELPERQGGLGLGPVETAVLLEEVGRHAAPAPFVSSVLALGALARAGLDERVDELVRSAGVGCIAWSRRAGAVRAEPDGDGWVLTGRPDPTPYAPSASVAIVAAVDAGVPALFAVDLDAVGRPSREPAIDQTRELGWLDLSGAPAVRIGGADAVSALVDRGAMAASAEMLGGASRVLDMAVEYAKVRVQFGRPIGSFQAVKHRCADMLVDVEGMRSTTYWAAWCVGAAAPDASVAASTAKIWCSDASKRVMASALQVHGGIGFTWEHDLHLFLKRAQLDQLSFGDAVFHRERLAQLLRPKVEAGESVI
ncbi:MAG TPA: acyl-CoA dehydrogenase family protein [Acidimicrobiia bacterium]|nr:acyl-CoA dehydrogenase family protein [Acidimicrobiia bacterium]